MTKSGIIVGCTLCAALLAHHSMADDPKSERQKWLAANLYGSDNGMAALRAVRIIEEKGKYRVHIQNQFSFRCKITFSAKGFPEKLLNCVSPETVGNPGQDDTKWASREREIRLACTTLKTETVCRGNYTLLPNDSKEFMTIARRTM